ncbi:hypothetical protein E2C01_007619 [Portunus trituberculatus]|uniref:Uncharacterized protein n=1 Tax=Portunus trituberculatus TaxID=210409 RepID=A0A5B7D1N5_PORTR|nr:hypothetical protein [Portunus trituberculatus]
MTPETARSCTIDAPIVFFCPPVPNFSHRACRGTTIVSFMSFQPQFYLADINQSPTGNLTY